MTRSSKLSARICCSAAHSTIPDLEHFGYFSVGVCFRRIFTQLCSQHWSLTTMPHCYVHWKCPCQSPDLNNCAQVLVGLQRSVSLLFTPIEDANLGMWLAALAARRVNWKLGMLTYGRPCCFFEMQCALTPLQPALGRVACSHNGRQCQLCAAAL